MLLTAAGLITSCQTEEFPGGGENVRKITVFADNIDNSTRTSIEYEYSDYSHLVWNEGDVVAYVTDLSSDVVKEAVVTESGYFTAELPAEAGSDNTLYVLYPGEGHAGGSAADLRLQIAETQQQDSVQVSTGIDIPMYAVATVPQSGETSLHVKYEIPVAVIRFEILSSDYATDMIQSITVTAQEPLAGDIDVRESQAGSAAAFTGTSNSVTTTVTRPSAIERGGYVYVPVARGTYSGVSVEVTTDNNTFTFPDGTFSLDDPEASLYKVQLVLGEGSVVPPEPYFAEIAEGEQFSADNSYLIAYKQSDNTYRVASNHISSKIDGSTFNIDPELGGIKAEGEVMDYVFTIAPVEGTGCYYLYSEAAGNTNGNYVGSAGGETVEGNFFFMTTIPTADDNYYIWDITYNSDGTQTLYNEGRNRYFKYSSNLGYFCTSIVGNDNPNNEPVHNVTILKLTE